MPRTSLRILCLLFFLGPGILAPLNAQDSIAREPVPAWAELLDPDLSPLSPMEEDGSGGSHILLYDRHIHIPSQTRLYHEVTLLRNGAGVDASSRLQVWFDPSYQRFALHRLRVHRNGEVFNLTDRQPFRVREREPSLEWNLYDGRLSAEALLEDIRPGDVVEWVYSVKGDNPIFGGRTFESFGLSSNVALRRYRIRVLLPDDDSRRFHMHRLPDTPSHWVRRGKTVIESDMRNLLPSPIYPDAPSWYWPFPGFSVGEYVSWDEVVAWALPLYQTPGRIPEALREDVARMNALPSDEAKILHALRFSQETLRYVSIHSGLHSHQPYPVEDVLRQRFGDCKDKAMMMITLLRAAGIEAHPGLVNTRLRHTIADHLPSPLLFDHVIVGVRESNGAVIWLDPTDSHQRGPLNGIFVPAYGKILWIRPGEIELRDMSGAGFDSALIRVRERYVLPNDPAAPVWLHATTQFEGVEAEIIRAHLASTSLRELQEQFEGHYTRLHQSARQEALPVVEDQESINRVTIRESWILDDPWKPMNGDPVSHLEFEPYFTHLLNRIPPSLRPDSPFALAHPKRVHHDIEIVFPFHMDFELNEFERSTKDFRFRFHETQTGNTLAVSYVFETRRDHVPPERLAEYKQILEECQTWESYWIANPWDYQTQWGDDAIKPFHPNLPLIAFGILLWVLVAFATWSFGNRSQNPLPVDDKIKRPKLPLEGIGGWLLLPIISLILGIGYRLMALFNEVYWDYDMGTWQTLASPASDAYHPLWAPFIFLGLVNMAWGLGAFPVHLVLVFRRKTRVKHLFVLLYVIAMAATAIRLVLVLGLGDHVPTETKFSAFGQVAGTLVPALVWIPYFLTSVRVKRTFVR